MLTTAKSLQLLDASGLNISPITDITSLYYEIEREDTINSSIIARKFLYSDFPVGVNIDRNIIEDISTHNIERPNNLKLYEDGSLYKLIDELTGKDIYVSNLTTSPIPGTTLRLIDVSQYNLSEILTYYTPLDYMDASIHEVDVSIDDINSHIRHIDSSINELYKTLNASNGEFNDDFIIKYANNDNLIPNKFYLISDYYRQSNEGCMDLPNTLNFEGPDNEHKLSVLIKANSKNSFDGKIYNMYDHSGNSLNVYGTFKIVKHPTWYHIDKYYIQITYLKDQYGNEAPYDFYNLKYNGGSGNTYYWTYNYDSSNMLMDENTKDKVKNNIIKTDPFESNTMPIFSCKLINYSINNNYIGTNNTIYLKNIEILCNNKIENNNIIKILPNDQGSSFLMNSIINSNNNINVTIDGYAISLNNICINNNNNIDFSHNSNIGYLHLMINSSNNITLYSTNNKNTTILNNCNASINLSDNIVVDNYVSTDTLQTEPNSVYLFKLNVYAKSFNTTNF